jgi:hypothetical protein
MNRVLVFPNLVNKKRGEKVTYVYLRKKIVSFVEKSLVIITNMLAFLVWYI